MKNIKVVGMQVFRESNGSLEVLSAEEKQLVQGIPLRIMKLLAEGERYPKEIARELRAGEQKIYYHIRQLEKKGFIALARKEERSGALAKVYRLSSPAFVARFGNFSPAKRLPVFSGLEPFIRDGRLNSKIIVGSPDPHGPDKARSRDISFAVDLALFLGTFLTKSSPSVIEDKDARGSDLRNNLIVIGGPVTNKVTKMLNDHLPVRFDGKKNIRSGRKTYTNDDCGFAAIADNPFDKSRKIIVIAGKRFSGTKAAVLGFMNSLRQIEKKKTMIFEGIDNDGDGEIDDARILE